jgi:hypothetical protein
VWLAETKLGRVLDRHQPLFVADEPCEDARERGLAAAGASVDDAIRSTAQTP